MYRKTKPEPEPGPGPELGLALIPGQFCSSARVSPGNESQLNQLETLSRTAYSLQPTAYNLQCAAYSPQPTI